MNRRPLRVTAALAFGASVALHLCLAVALWLCLRALAEAPVSQVGPLVEVEMLRIGERGRDPHGTSNKDPSPPASLPAAPEATASDPAARDMVETKEVPPSAKPVAVAGMMVEFEGGERLVSEQEYLEWVRAHNRGPAFPGGSRKSGEQGRAVVRVTVASSGSIDSVHIDASSGFERLDQAALAAVRGWNFPPYRSETSRHVFLLPFSFVLRPRE